MLSLGVTLSCSINCGMSDKVPVVTLCKRATDLRNSAESDMEVQASRLARGHCSILLEMTCPCLPRAFLLQTDYTLISQYTLDFHCIIALMTLTESISWGLITI